MIERTVSEQPHFQHLIAGPDGGKRKEAVAARQHERCAADDTDPCLCNRDTAFGDHLARQRALRRLLRRSPPLPLGAEVQRQEQYSKSKEVMGARELCYHTSRSALHRSVAVECRRDGWS